MAVRKAFLKDIKGATAIEFALIAAPFFAILMATIELAVIFWVNGALIEAISQPARTVLVGDKIDAQKFKQLICDKAGALIDCDRLLIDVESFDKFSTITKKPLIDPKTGELIPSRFETGKGGDVVVVRVAYPYQMLTPFLHGFTSNMSGNRRLIIATNVFKNEPFNE
jgi:Flp pilus assembly protein TadG